MRGPWAWMALLGVGCTAPPAEEGTDEPTDTEPVPIEHLREQCFPGLGDSEAGLPEYDDMGATYGSHCAGTNHQDISGIQKVVFLGDSVTAGTPPTPYDQVYRALVVDGLEERFGPLEVANCSEWGARTDDLLESQPSQIDLCFPEVEPLRTLVVMTVGGNDMMSAAEGFLAGQDEATVLARVAHESDLMEEGIAWFREQEATRFPAGVSVIFGNVYEFTDGTGDMSSCPSAPILGFEGEVPQMRSAYVAMNERFMQIAVATGTDMIFMLEHFCGHGWRSDDPTNECYRGPDTERWFDPSCIHPSPEGHAALADLFLRVVDE